MNLENYNKISDEKGNVIYFSKKYALLDEIKINSIIKFNGSNNVVFLATGAVLENSNIICGNENLVFIAKSRLQKVSINPFFKSVCYVGNNNYFNPGGAHSLSLSERANIIIGDDCLISHTIWFRTADPHLIYDMRTNKRINRSKSIVIGDHVWISQEVCFLKGAFVASGAIIGARAVVGSKIFFSNTINAGVPCREVKNNIFWSSECTHSWDEKMSLLHEKKKAGNFKFTFNKNDFLDIKELDEKLSQLKSSIDKLHFVFKKLYLNKNQNRFAISKNDANKLYLSKISNNQGGGSLPLKISA